MIKGTTRPVPKRSMKLDLRASIHNRFDVEVYDAATGKLKQRACAFNVILNTYWDRLLYVSSGEWKPYPLFEDIYYGDGSGTPAVTDTALFNQLGRINVNSTKTYTRDRRNGIFTAQANATLNAEDAVGKTITEIGIGGSDSYYGTTFLTTHAMLQDMEGNPISILKTNTDVIKFYATVFLHWPNGGWYSGAVNFCATTDNAGQSAYFASLAGILLGEGFSTPRFNLAGISTHTGDSGYINDYFQPSINRSNKTITISRRLAAADANVPIRAIALRSANYRYSTDVCFWLVPGSWFAPPTITGEAVGTGTGAKTGFATAFPIKSGAVVYVDGVQQSSGVTVRTGPANAARMDLWFNMLANTNANALSASGAPLYASTTGAGADYITAASMNAGYVTYAYENPFYALGLAKFQAQAGSSASLLIQASDDCNTWTDVGTASVNSNAWTDIAVPAALKNKKYFRFKNAGSSTRSFYIRAVGDVTDTENNIVFDTAPVSGAVITVSYVPDCIAKDSSHVFDLSVVLTLGEYQGD